MKNKVEIVGCWVVLNDKHIWHIDSFKELGIDTELENEEFIKLLVDTLNKKSEVKVND
jgi:hypothetical protein